MHLALLLFPALLYAGTYGWCGAGAGAGDIGPLESLMGGVGCRSFVESPVALNGLELCILRDVGDSRERLTVVRGDFVGDGPP